MDIEYIKDNYKFETLTEKHDLSNFECGSDDLNDFVKNDALIQQQDKINITKLITCDDEIIGFVSLLTDTIPLKNIRDENIRLKLKHHYNENIEKVPKKKQLPAIKIGRFAIDEKYAQKGLGSFIFRNVLLSILHLSKTKVGLRFITVEAYAMAFNFYVKKNNFTYRKSDEKLVKKLESIIQRDPERQFNLHLDLKDIQLSSEELEELGLSI